MSVVVIPTRRVLLFAWFGQQGQQPKDDVTQHPDEQNKADSERAADGCACACGFIGGAVQFFADKACVGNQPEQHQDVEQDQRPFEQDAKEPAFGFAQGVSAVGAVVGLIGNGFRAAGAILGGHLCVPFVVAKHLGSIRSVCAYARNACKAMLLPAFALCLLAVPGGAKASACQLRADAIDVLTAHGEQRQSYGLTRAGGLVEVFANLDTGSWTVTITSASGITCAVAAGHHFDHERHAPALLGDAL